MFSISLLKKGTEGRKQARTVALPSNRTGNGQPGRLFGMPKRLWDRLRRRNGSAEEGSFLPLMIEVLAEFAKVDGVLLEAEVDSTLSFLRYDYPDAVYSELRDLYIRALHEEQNLTRIAQKLNRSLSPERKIMLGVQLYDLINKAGARQEQVMAYYSFMSQLDMSIEAIEISNQLSTDEACLASGHCRENVPGPFEVLISGGSEDADIYLRELDADEFLVAYRFEDLILLRNLSDKEVLVRGRVLPRGQFRRLFPSERIVINEKVIAHQDVIFFFNAKKNIVLQEVYVRLQEDRHLRLERDQTRESEFYIRFGLRVQIRCLKDTGATIDGIGLRKGLEVEVNHDDRVIFPDGTELDLSDLRRRAREMGSPLRLTASKTEYLVSNNPSALKEGDILLSASPGGEVLLRIQCDYDQRNGRVEVLKADRPIMIDRVPVRQSALLVDGDVIQLSEFQGLRCNFSERVIEEERNFIRRIEVRDLSHRFGKNQVALDGISFSAQRGEMLCIMGPSGSGKSTLLHSLAAYLRPDDGKILLDGMDLFRHRRQLAPYIALVPHEDSFDPYLTVRENFSVAASLRSPHLTVRERKRRVDSKLAELGLQERKNALTFDPKKRILSGGERKRLNMGLDLLGAADVYLFDEPTSGLSSKDSENIMEILRTLTHNKVVIVTIHQPSSKLFHMFDKALLLDYGGRLVFHGTPTEMLQYFSQDEEMQELADRFVADESTNSPMQPEFVFDVLESPLRDFGGEIIYEENEDGQRVPARRFSPDYWRNKYESHRLLREVNEIAEQDDSSPRRQEKSRLATPFRLRLRDGFVRFAAVFFRTFTGKLRNRTNLAITGIVAPVLAFLIGHFLRFSEAADYDFASSFHIPTYIFLALVVSMFLGLTNSSDDIIRDREILKRERNLYLPLVYYIFSKFFTLALFAVVQCALFVLIANYILEVRGMFLSYLLLCCLTAFCGVAFGLLISSLAPDGKTAANVIPLILIPQIILGGALIKYEEMNTDWPVITRLQRYITEKSADGGPPPPLERGSDLQVPPICEIIPMRWSYEALVVLQGEHNPVSRVENEIQRRLDYYKEKDVLTETDERLFSHYKELAAYLNGLGGRSAGQVKRRLDKVEAFLSEPHPYAPLDTQIEYSGGRDENLAESYFVNQKIEDLMIKADIEQTDYRRQRHINVFFGTIKRYFGREFDVVTINLVVLNGITLVLLVILFFTLRWQIRRI